MPEEARPAVRARTPGRPGRSCRPAAQRSRRAATQSSRLVPRGRASESLSRLPPPHERVNAGRGDLGGAHGLDDGCAAVRDVTGGEVLGVRRLPRLALDLRPAALELEPVDQLEELSP